jgi:ParB family chromosome partitioning protein
LAETPDELQAVASGRTADGETVFLLALDQIDPNPYQTRREFDQELLAELADSIRVQGVLQPVVVRPGKEGRFVLILGERRLRASRLAEKTTIPVIVRRVSEQQAAEMTLVENLQRLDLNCVEQAEAFANLSKQFKLTQEEIGGRAGVSRETVSNYMRLLALPEGVIGALQMGRLTYSHARALLQLRDNVQIWTFAKKAIEEKMSVAKLEDLVLGVSAPIGLGEPKNKGGGARWVDPNVKAAQRSLETVLGMRVRIRDRNGRGKILIEYATLEDFDRVVRMLKGK